MPNLITNKIVAPKHVIEAMLNADGRIDFNTMAPFQGPNDWDGIYMDAETAAEVVCRIPASDNPLVARLEAYNRANIDIKRCRKSRSVSSSACCKTFALAATCIPLILPVKCGAPSGTHSSKKQRQTMGMPHLKQPGVARAAC